MWSYMMLSIFLLDCVSISFSTMALHLPHALHMSIVQPAYSTVLSSYSASGLSITAPPPSTSRVRNNIFLNNK